MKFYHNIQVRLGAFFLAELRDLKVVRKFNEHARITLTALLTAQQADQCLESVNPITPVEVTLVEGTVKECLFNGIVTDFNINVVQDVYYLNLSGASYTYNLDVRKQSRSFQNQGVTYRGLVKAVIGDTTGADSIINSKVADRPTGRFILQYYETNWELLKRIASCLGLGLISDATAKGPKFWLGLPEISRIKELVNVNYRIQKKLDVYRELAIDGRPKLIEDDFVFYEVEWDGVAQVGESFRFQNKELVVAEATAEMRQGVLKHNYVLTTAAALRQKATYNLFLAGLALEGQVVAVESDLVKVQLDIDGGQSTDEACWFPYATSYTAEGHTGSFCMPELGDAVKLYFPTKRETEAYVINSVRRKEKDAERLQDPAVKCFRTINGAGEEDAISKELRFNNRELSMTLSGKDDMNLKIQIDDQTGVTIASDQEIAITAIQDLTFQAGQKLTITAGESIELTCQTSQIIVDDWIQIDGTKINREM